jgi:hypothetical protein
VDDTRFDNVALHFTSKQAKRRRIKGSLHSFGAKVLNTAFDIVIWVLVACSRTSQTDVKHHDSNASLLIDFRAAKVTF